MRVARTIYKIVPAYFRRVVFEIFASILCFLSGLSLLFGVAESQAVSAELPIWIQIVWAWALVIGPIFIVLGLIVQVQVKLQDIPFWRKIEAMGLGQLAFVSYIYVMAILMQGGLRAVPATGMIIVFAFTCTYRICEIYVDLENFMHEIGARNGKHS